MEKLIEYARTNFDTDYDINLQTILDSAENVDNNYIGDHSLKTITKEVIDVLNTQEIQQEDIYKYTNSLLHYRVIEHVYHIHKGKHVRWLRNGKLTNGGIVVDVKFLDNGTHILCKNRNRFIQYKFDDCATFQKLTTDELLILQIKDSV